ncbi:NB-ARC domain-containing protein [Kribbella sp. NPDC058245]|uniref:NB-ARC domain-containing protein n=1 Tax=Kribbella sp. NPDC058245 TaxID=3346399 RepID=UPI0036EF980D
MEETFAAALLEARRARGLSQEALATRAGLSGQAIGLLERGVRRYPHLTTLDKLHLALDLTAEERARFKRLASRGTPTDTESSLGTGGSPWTVVDQLPATRAAFTGRLEDLDQLKRALTAGEAQAGATVVVTVRGMAGVGKTALTVEAASACRAAYPDGILSVNLRGFGTSTPLSPLQVIGQLLRATGVPAESVPTDEADAIAALRTRLANRKVLLLLDNARDVAQVTDLIPSTSGSAVLITSRNTLTTLPARLHLQLEPMPSKESVELLTTAAGSECLGDSADQIADLCGHLPLALSVAGAWLLRHPETSAAELVRRLTDETRRLDLLGVDDRDVRASLALSIDQLISSPRPRDHDAAHTFTLLGLTAAEDFTAESTAALLDTTPPKAGNLLEHLTDLHLLEAHAPGRYQFHDLVRTYAHELADRLPKPERDAAFDRFLAFYLAVVWRSADLAEPKSARKAWPGRPPAPTFPALNRSEEAFSWIDAELTNYLAVIRQAVALPAHHEAAAGVVIGLYSYFAMRGNLTDWLPAIEEVIGGRIDGWTVAQLHADAAIALAELARYAESAVRFGQARDAFETIGNLRGVSLTANNKARLLVRMERYGEALPLVEEALAINKELGNERATAASYGTLIEIRTELGEWGAIEADAAAAMELFGAGGHLGSVANIRIEAAWARVRAGRPEAALGDLLLSLGELQALGQRKSVCDAHWILGLTYLRLEELESAIEHAESALEIALDVSDIRREAQIRLLLSELLNEIGDRDEAVANVDFALHFYRQHDPGKAAAAEALLEKIRNETSA